MHFHRTSLADIQTSLPSLIGTAELLAKKPSFDLVVCVNGFEERTVAVPQWLAKNQISCTHAVVLTYPTNQADNQRTIALLGSALAGAESIQSLDVGMPAPELREKMLDVAETASIDGQLRVLLDVSGASGRIILRTMRTLFGFARDRRLTIDLTVSYAEAQSYSPTQEAAEALVAAVGAPDTEATLGLDYDAEELAPTVEYPGQHIDKVVDRVVVICGFNAVRTRAALDHIDSAFNSDFPHPRVTYIAGCPPREEDAWRLSAMVAINSLPDREPMAIQEASTLHYSEALRRLETQYRESFGSERITVIPFGSKMQTVATALFCELHPEVKVQLVAPARYAGHEYSSGIGTIHFLPMGDLNELQTLFERVDRIVEVGVTSSR